MTDAGRQLIEVFETLPDADKREVMAAILRGALRPPYDSPSDDDLLRAADELFLDLDQREAGG